jgi:uncharacterized protein (DUF1330 family)
MIPFVKTGIAILVGAGIGAVSMQTLRAQAKPPAFVVAEVDVTNQDAYMKEFLPARAKAIAAAGGRYIVRGDQPRGVAGQPPAGRVAVVQFDNIDKLIAFTESAGFKDSQAIGEKYAKIRIYGVEGVPK